MWKPLKFYLFIYLPFLLLRKESYLAGRKICLSWKTGHNLFLTLSLLTALIWTFQWSGVSIKIEVAICLDRVTDWVTRGCWSPLLGGGWGQSKCIPPLKILKFQVLKMWFSAFWGLNSRTKERVFHSRKCSFQFISHTINSYEQWTNDEN